MTDQDMEAVRIPRWIDMLLGVVAVLAIVAAVLRVSGWSTVDRDKLDGTTLAFLLVPFAWALVRRAKILKIGPSGLEFEAIQREVAETKEAARQTAARVDDATMKLHQTAAVVRDTRLALAHGVGGRGAVRTDAALRAYVTREFPTATAESPTEEPGAERSDDPQKGRWGGRNERDGRKLTAHVAPVDNDADWFRVELDVESTEDKRPIEGPIRFHLHPTFVPPVVTVFSRNGHARLERLAYGAFTVGVEVQGASGKPSTLELDLADVDEAPPGFRAR